jgi:hypothetical protein
MVSLARIAADRLVKLDFKGPNALFKQSFKE